MSQTTLENKMQTVENKMDNTKISMETKMDQLMAHILQKPPQELNISKGSNELSTLTGNTPKKTRRTKNDDDDSSTAQSTLFPPDDNNPDTSML